ncbi:MULTISPECIES: hypothetical protein [Paraburkholderia]|uniref:DUF2846 domain-containing protein n=1 Tax=Paraburkholderia madseniana TaxID=2599607 RepID=A0AAP5BM57_9BURK|nr:MULTISPECIES: hypothetical protein [Paraburkholderia]MCX4152341.1 hypothetical protein [Paraburkholderia madseniana]MCX4177849.1 hypothetical protein [Paraburkholderia madseniana]MDN7155270.1 hypothetical protein [Paraburkholderia sp. WS6]MDQ6414153.1 hypothetical protein [Paraburkholderia madseniana]MDQ6465836.1 hypothetical protein [Paraburkholderia madseniana]
MLATAYRTAAIAAIIGLCACAQTQVPQTQRNMKPGAIYIFEPKKPTGLAGPGEFTLTPDGKIHVIQPGTTTTQ